VGACFHDDEVPLGDGLELVRGHEGPLDHLEALVGVVLPPGDGAAHHGAAAQSLGQHFGGLAVGGKAAEDGVLAVIRQDLRPLLAVVLLQLGQALDDGHQSQPPGAASGEQGQNVEGGHGAQLVTEKHHPAGQLPVVFIRHREQLPTQGLDHQPSHEVFGLIFLRKYLEDGGFLCGKALGVYGAVETQHLLQLRVQEGVQPGEDGGHDGGHRLLGGGEGGAGEPLGLVFLRQAVHEELELILAGQNAGGQQLLHQLEY